MRMKHLIRIREEARSFIESNSDEQKHFTNEDYQKYITRARERAWELLARIDIELGDKYGEAAPKKASLVYQGCSL